MQNQARSSAFALPQCDKNPSDISQLADKNLSELP